MDNLTTTNLVTMGTALIGAAIVVSGWVVTNAQARTKRVADARIAFIADAFLSLMSVSNRAPTPETSMTMASSMAKIQLYGNQRELEALNVFFVTWDKPQEHGHPIGELDPLLIALRNSLRAEFGLAQIDSPPRWFIMEGGFDPATQFAPQGLQPARW